METRQFESIEVYDDHPADGAERIDPEQWGLDVEYIEQEKTPAMYSQALFDELWATGKFSSNEHTAMVGRAIAYGVTYGGERYYLGRVEDFGVTER